MILITWFSVSIRDYSEQWIMNHIFRAHAHAATSSSLWFFCNLWIQCLLWYLELHPVFNVLCGPHVLILFLCDKCMPCYFLLHNKSPFGDKQINELEPELEHSYTDGRGNHARHQPAHREQLGVQSLSQGLFDINSGGARDRTGNLSGTLCVPMTATLPLSHCRPCRPCRKTWLLSCK